MFFFILAFLFLHHCDWINTGSSRFRRNCDCPLNIHLCLCIFHVHFGTRFRIPWNIQNRPVKRFQIVKKKAKWILDQKMLHFVYKFEVSLCVYTIFVCSTIFQRVWIVTFVNILTFLVAYFSKNISSKS